MYIVHTLTYLVLIFCDRGYIIQGAINLNVMKICTFLAILVIQRVIHCKVLEFFMENILWLPTFPW